jgi:hypothetical protein
MARLYKSLLFACVAAVTLFTASCRKGDYSAPVPVTTVATDDAALNTLLTGLRTAPQDLIVTAGTTQTIYGDYGTRLTFYPNSFKDANGNILSKGLVNIRLREVYTVGDMVANRVATTADGKLLTSGGQVQITATMNGREVFANKYGIGFRQLNPSRQPMALYYGDGSDFTGNWTISNNLQAGTFVPGTTSSADTNVIIVITSGGVDTVITHGVITNYYQFDSCANFNWVNCDYFYTPGAQLTNIRVMMPDTSFNQSNTEVFIVFPSINAAARMTLYDPSRHTFELQAGYYVPLGLPVDIVVVSKQGVSYYYDGQTGLTTSNNMFLYADMALASLDYIRSQLSGL